MARGDFDQGLVNAETPLEHMVLQLEPSAAQQAALESDSAMTLAGRSDVCHG
jgi:hypothetical protein